MTGSEQLPLPLPVRTALGREDYFVSETNALAVAQIDDWQAWQPRKFVLTGPEGSGKTHLAHVWAAQSDALILPASALPEADIPSLAQGNICIEDMDRSGGDPAAEESLFHLHNLTLASGNALMVTARAPVQDWRLQLPDLRSRMMGAAGARLGQPDDALLTALLLKLFSDRQIMPAPDVIPYLASHMPRRYTMAHALVDRLDRAALARSGGVTRPLAKSVLTVLAQEADTGHP